MLTEALDVQRLLDEGVEQVAQLAARLPPRKGKRRRPDTLVGWIVRGREGVHLEGFTDSDGSYLSSWPAVARFYAALTAKRRGHVPEPSPTEEARRREAREASERLMAAMYPKRKRT